MTFPNVLFIDENTSPRTVFKFENLNPSNQSVDQEMGTVIHEVPGQNGGVINVTGLKTRTINLNGKFIGSSDEVTSLADNFNQIFRRGNVVKLASYLATTRVIIKSFKPMLDAGLGDQIPYTIQCIEYRNPNVRLVKVNQVNLSPKNDMLERLIARQVISPIES